MLRVLGTKCLRVPNVALLQFAFYNLHSLLLLSSAPASIVDTIERVQPKMVKIYGAGGFRDMEAYQSGILISPEGHILTVFSHVLDTDYITAVLADGRKFEAKLLGAIRGWKWPC